jgi:hypothetical protein
MSLYLLSMCVLEVVCSLILSVSFCNHDMIVCIYMNGVPVLFKLFVQGCSKCSSHHVINRQCIYFCGGVLSFKHVLGLVWIVEFS